MKRFLVVFALVISGCGGGGGGGGSSSSWTGSRTAQGYPLISGTYRVDYSSVSGPCSDGSNLTLDGSSHVVRVDQSESRISVVQIARVIADISDTPATGDISKNAEFELDRHRVVNVNGTPLEVDYDYDGQAFENGIVGDITAHITVPRGSCDIKGTFSGNKLS